jgi:hypothetical protein
MPAPLTAQQSALTISKRRPGNRQEVAAAAGAPAKAKARSALEGPPWPSAGADAPAGRPAWSDRLLRLHQGQVGGDHPARRTVSAPASTMTG